MARLAGVLPLLPQEKMTYKLIAASRVAFLLESMHLFEMSDNLLRATA